MDFSVEHTGLEILSSTSCSLGVHGLREDAAVLCRKHSFAACLVYLKQAAVARPRRSVPQER